MGAVNKGNWFQYPDNESQDFLIPYAFASVGIAVETCDLCYFKGTVAAGDVAYPADQLASAGSEALDQFAFAAKFCGISQQKILLAETNILKRFTLKVRGPINMACPSQTWKHGDLVGIYSNGITLDPQQVDKVTNPSAAIGVCTKDYPNPTTRVLLYFQCRTAEGVLTNLNSASLFEAQAMTAGSVLSDANQVLTVASPFFSTMINTSGRNLQLPLESASKSLAFMHANLAASVGANTFKSSSGGAILSNGVVPAGKTGFAFCDGISWYGFISA